MSETVGYPDYQRLSAQAANVLGFIQAQIGNNPFSPMQDAQGFGYINLSINDLGGSGYFTVTVSWYLYDNTNAQLSTFVCTPTPGGEQTLQIPVISRYFQVVVNWISGTKTDEPLIVWFGANVPANPQINSQPGKPFLFFVESVAANGSYTQQATTTIQGGACACIIQSGNDLWSAVIDYFDWTTAGWESYILLEGATFGQSFLDQLSLPPAPIRATVNNMDTSAHTFHFSLTIN